MLPVIVSTLHIPHSGEIISTREDFEKVQERFSWADKSSSIHRIIKLRQLTDEGKKSLTVFYEKDHLIKEYINIDGNFKPSNYC